VATVDSTSLPALPTVECRYCGTVVPDAGYCGACGAHLVHEGFRASQRLHSYAAFPDEPVLRVSQVSALFPHLSHRAKAPFRAGLGIVIVLIAVLSVAGASAPLIAVCALGVPLLFVLYLVEVDPYEESFAIPSGIAILLGAGLGAGWAVIASPYVDRALQPSPVASLTDGRTLAAAILVPGIAQLLMCVPLVIIRLLLRGRLESLDGFAAGSTGALGFTMASTITLLAPWLSTGQLLHLPITTSLAQAVFRGLTWPLVSAMLTGLVGAAWSTRLGTGPTSARGRWLTSPALALLAALVVQIGLGFAALARLPETVLILTNILAIAAVILVVRIVLHHVLLHEVQVARIGPPRACPQCSHLVPAMPFCPNCGICDRALARPVRGPAPPPIPHDTSQGTVTT
jgi:rRNA maturation endonuclease Nob1